MLVNLEEVLELCNSVEKVESFRSSATAYTNMKLVTVCRELVKELEQFRCSSQNKYTIKEPWVNDIHNWWLFTIRSWDLEELNKHKNDLERIGFIVENIELVNSTIDSIPHGWYKFRASIEKSKLNSYDRQYLDEWDRKWGEKRSNE